MSESQGVSSLPLPPMQFVNLYNEENIRRARVPRPPQTFHDVYSMFGIPFHTDDLIIRPLESQGIKRLYPQNFDHKKELKKLNHSILANFLDLLDILIKSPGTPKREEKIDDINLLFIHMHHLINEFRPHQARETLRVMMEVQRRQRLETAERFQKHLDKVIEILQSSLAALPEHSDIKPKLFASTESMDAENWNQSQDASDISSRLDIIMCDIIDNIN